MKHRETGRNVMRGAFATAMLAFAGAHAQLPTRPTTPLPATTVAEIVVTDIALAYSLEEGASGLDIESWTESGAAIGDTLGARVDYFTVVPETIALGVGGRLDLASLQITTHGLNGNPVPRAPFKLTLEVPAGMLDIDLAVAEHELSAIRPGIGRLWIESLLPRGTGTGERYRLPVVIRVR